MNALEPGCGFNESRPALPRYVASLRRAVVDFAADAGADELQLENIGLALSEAVSNSVIHAYPASANVGDVTVKAWTERDGIVVTVCDDGCGMTPRSDSPGLGLGLSLIARVTEHLDVQDCAPRPGVMLRMTFPLRHH